MICYSIMRSFQIKNFLLYLTVLVVANCDGGSFEQTITLNLPSSGCGVRLSTLEKSKNGENDQLQYVVSIMVQMDRHLRQITDQETTVSCQLNQDQIKLHSNAMRQAVMDIMKKDKRKGRMKTDWSTDEDLDMQFLDESRAWMEISGEKPTDTDTLQVGETMKLTVKSTLPENIGWRIINCMAHDGIGDSSQKLLDDYGCPIDEQILPELKFSKPRMIGPNTNKILTRRNQNKIPETVWNARSKRAVVKKTGEELKSQMSVDFLDNDNDRKQQQPTMMRYQEASVEFPAFKFPDRDRLHLNCGLQLCKNNCQQIDCKAIRRSSRHLSKQKIKDDNKSDRLIRKDSILKSDLIETLNLHDDIIDTLEVYNSVEVIAPDIELDDYRGRKRDAIKEYTKGRTKLITNIPGDRAFCVSTNKMALAFCLLGIIFLIGVIIAIISLLRSRRKDIRSYYSRSVFSSSTSTGSGFGGSKLLLHESPCLGANPTWQYGRAY